MIRSQLHHPVAYLHFRMRQQCLKVSFRLMLWRLELVSQLRKSAGLNSVLWRIAQLHYCVIYPHLSGHRVTLYHPQVHFLAHEEPAQHLRTTSLLDLMLLM